MPRLLLTISFLLTLLSSSAQQPGDLEKKLNIFWKSKHLRARMIAETAAFRPGDTLADIGTADGWFAAALSVHTDSLTFYLEDIDSTIWNRQKFDAAVAHFAALNETNVSHQYHYVKGTGTSTRLPHNTFDAVLIIDTYHHFAYRKEMLSDIASLLKPGGRIVMLEALARKSGDIHQGCRSNIFSHAEIIADLRTHGMELEKTRFIHRVARRKNQLFIFRKGGDN